MHWQFDVNLVSEKIAKVGHKSEDISESVNRFDLGAIFPSRLCQDLSRNASVVSILFPGGISLRSKDFFMTPKSRDFHEISSFLESCREASRKLLGCLESVLECFRVSRNDFWTPKNVRKMSGISIFWCF